MSLIYGSVYNACVCGLLHWTLINLTQIHENILKSILQTYDNYFNVKIYLYIKFYKLLNILYYFDLYYLIKFPIYHKV
jgi:hypothetical protein